MEKLVKPALFAKEGATSSMTTGQLASLRQQIHALNSEINEIRHETAPYWFDARLVVQPTASGAKVVEVSNRQENALKADYYEGETEVALSPEERDIIINKYVEQKPNNEKLVETYSNTTIKTDSDIKKLKEIFKSFQKDNEIELKKIIESFAQFWHHVQMPLEFGYTGAILSNHSGQGLLHTFARHWDQWLEYIPSLSNLMGNLDKDIRILLQNVQGAQNKTARKALKKFTKAINGIMDNLTYVLVKKTLLEIQMELLEFLKTNITSVQYREEGVNGNGQVQVYFKVTNISGVEGIMVVAMSEQLFLDVEEFGDSRPVRIIITVFFLTNDQYQKLQNRTKKAWPNN